MLGVLVGVFSLIVVGNRAGWYTVTWGVSLIVLLSIFGCWSYSSLYNYHGPWSGHDMLSQTLSCLTLYIIMLVLLASVNVLKTFNNDKLFLSTVSTLLFVLLCCFYVSNSLLFYFFFEASLIPTVMLILGWGYQPERLMAGNYMIIYTVCGSLPLLAGLCWMWNECNSGSIYVVHLFRLPQLGPSSVELCFFLFFTAFIVNLPIFSLHLWLPKAHVEAPVGGSMVLAAVLLKLGGYGILRVYQYVNYSCGPVGLLYVFVALWGGILISVVCFRQTDIKCLIAYSSICHISLVFAGLMSESVWGWSGGLCLILAHGFCSSGLFVLANIMYSKTGTRSLIINKGFLACLPSLSVWVFAFCVINIAAPPSLNLLGEIIIYISCATWSWCILCLVGVMSFLSAVYSLYLYSGTQHGPISSLVGSISPLNSSDNLVMFLHLVPVNIFILSANTPCCWV